MFQISRSLLGGELLRFVDLPSVVQLLRHHQSLLAASHFARSISGCTCRAAPAAAKKQPISDSQGKQQPPQNIAAAATPNKIFIRRSRAGVEKPVYAKAADKSFKSPSSTYLRSISFDSLSAEEKERLSKPPPITQSIAPAMPSPNDNTDPSIRYCVFPQSNYLVGSDGTVWNRTSHRPIAGVLSAGGSVAFQIPFVDGRTGTTFRDTLVMHAHGHPPPTPEALLVHRDGQYTNDRLANLYWETVEDLLKREVLAAHQRGKKLEFRQYSIDDRWWIGSDGRVWSTSENDWLEGSDVQGDGVRVFPYYSGTVEPVGLRLRSEIVWEVFSGQLLTDSTRSSGTTASSGKKKFIVHLDGDRFNDAFDNLHADSVEKFVDREIKLARVKGDVNFDFKPYPELPSYLVTTDGRIWNSNTKRWVEGNTPTNSRSPIALRMYRDLSDGSKEAVSRLRAKVVFETFQPRPFTPQERKGIRYMLHLDGNIWNDRVENIARRVKVSSPTKFRKKKSLKLYSAAQIRDMVKDEDEEDAKKE